MAFSPEQLISRLSDYPRPGRYWIAFSGGLDSTVLLHALSSVRSQLPAPLSALHANHGLQDKAGQWAAHCRRVCARLTIPLTEIELNLVVPPGESVEATARSARYRAFAKQVAADQMLLTAHHADDQVETFLLQWLRGAGVHGLAAMPECRTWQQGWLARPLLPYSRDELQAFAEAAGLNWMEDESNTELRFDRNYLRHEIIPLLRDRWPGLVMTSARSARHCASAANLADETADSDLEACRGKNSFRLSLSALCKLSRPRQENLLRHWIARHHLETPNAHRIRRILSEVVTARQDADPVVTWAGTQVRRFGAELYLLPSLPPEMPDWSTNWDGSGDLILPGGLGRLKLAKSSPGFAADFLRRGRVSVGFRREGLSCTPSGRRGSRSFKRLMQDLSIPPWLRTRIPLLFVDDTLAAVGEAVVCHPFSSQDFELQWERDVFL